MASQKIGFSFKASPAFDGCAGQVFHLFSPWRISV